MRSKLWLWMIPLLLLVMLLAVPRLDEALWVDEIWSAYYAGSAQYGPLTPTAVVNRIIDQYHHERNPPGYYLLLNLWGGAVGWSETASRMLSLLIGLLAVACMYRLGSDVLSPLAGLGSALTLGLSAFYISYLHELRMYTIYVLLVVFVLWAYWRIIRSEKPSLGIRVAYLLGVIAMFYTYFFSLLVLVGVGLAHLLLVRKNRVWWQLGVLTGLAAFTFIPWVGLLIQATNQSIVTIPTGALSTEALVNQVILYFSNSSVALLALVLIGAFTLRGWTERFLWLVMLTVFVLAVAISARFHVFLHTRYVLVLWPLLALLCGLGIEQLARRGVRPAWIMGVWTVAGVWSALFAYQPKMPYLDLMAELRTHGLAGDQLAFHAPDWDWLTEFELDHYIYGVPMKYTLLERIPGLKANYEYARNALTWLDNAPRVWFAIDRRLEPNFRLHEFELVLSRDYVGCSVEYTNSQVDMSLYAHKVTDPQVSWDIGAGLSLVEPVRVSADKHLTVLVGWATTPSPTLTSYSIGLHVLDANGQLVAQIDNGLPTVRDSCERYQIDATALPAGDYSLAAVVYNWQTGERATGTDGTVGDYFTLATFDLD